MNTARLLLMTVKLSVKWGIDGVDMDWEFRLSWSGDPIAYDVAVDVANHVLLMKQLRETLGNQYLLTYAGYCMDKQQVPGGWRYIDIAAVEPYVDFVNIMTYDWMRLHITNLRFMIHRRLLTAPGSPGLSGCRHACQ